MNSNKFPRKSSVYENPWMKICNTKLLSSQAHYVNYVCYFHYNTHSSVFMGGNVIFFFRKSACWKEI